MTFEMARRFILSTNWPSKSQTSRESNSPTEDIANKLDEDPSLIKLLRDYEFDKYYKYAVIFQYEKITYTQILKLLNDKKIINEGEEILNNNWRKPTLKQFSDSFDLKFSFTLGEGYNIQKYPVIISFFKDANVIVLKFSGISKLLEIEDYDYYYNLRKEAEEWLNSFLPTKVKCAPMISIFKKIFVFLWENKDIKKTALADVEPFSISASDSFGGKTSLRITDNDDLPLIDSMLKLSDKFENRNDQALLKNHLLEFVRKASYNRIGLTWSARFQDSRGKKVKISAVVDNQIYSGGDSIEKYEQIHFFSKISITRNKINHVVKGIFQYL